MDERNKQNTQKPRTILSDSIHFVKDFAIAVKEASHFKLFWVSFIIFLLLFILNIIYRFNIGLIVFLFMIVLGILAFKQCLRREKDQGDDSTAWFLGFIVALIFYALFAIIIVILRELFGISPSQFKILRYSIFKDPSQPT